MKYIVFMISIVNSAKIGNVTKVLNMIKGEILMSTNIESLVSTMNSNGFELTKKMNIKDNAIIINQQENHYFEEYKVNGAHIKEYGFNEKGIGLSRNSALLRSDAEICLMADDDMVYTDDYITKVKKAYKENPDADMIIFNVRIHDDNGTLEKVKKNGKVNYFNSLRYGTVSFSFKREKIIKKNIWFTLLFGGGAPFSNGEDSLFLWDCLKAGLNIYTSTDIIADVYNYESSWFEGYNKKYFFDRGALFEALSSRFSRLLIYQYAIRKRNDFNEKVSVKNAVNYMIDGSKFFKDL